MLPESSLVAVPVDPRPCPIGSPKTEAPECWYREVRALKLWSCDKFPNVCRRLLTTVLMGPDTAPTPTTKRATTTTMRTWAAPARRASSRYATPTTNPNHAERTRESSKATSPYDHRDRRQVGASLQAQENEDHHHHGKGAGRVQRAEDPHLLGFGTADGSERRVYHPEAVPSRKHEVLDDPIYLQ